MMPPEKMADLGEEMAGALAAAIKADPNDNVAVHRALWDAKMARIAELEAGIRKMHGAVPGGTVCDPQRVADALRDIAESVGVDVDTGL